MGLNVPITEESGVMEDKVTALITTYRRPEYLRRAILSVLRQTHGNLQISVFDDASNDGTREVVSNLISKDNRIKYWCHEPNIGSLPNFRYAFKSVNTPYFSVLSDDDFLATDFYESAINILKYNPDIMFVIMNTLIVDKDANLYGNCINTNILNFYRDDDRFDRFHSGDIPTTWTAMVFRKEVAQIYAEMDDRYEVGSDMRFLFHAAARYNFAYLSKVGAFFSYHNNSFSVSRSYVDPVYAGVQISRYVEICYDENVSQYIRGRFLFYARKILSRYSYKTILVVALKNLIKNVCNDTVISSDVIERDIKHIKCAGYVNTSAILNIVHKNKITSKILRTLFFPYYTKKIVRHKVEMEKLQDGIYKELFNYVKGLN